MKKTWMVARKSLQESWSEPLLSVLLLLFPAMMIGLYYLAFGQTSQGLSTLLRVMVKNDDQGEMGARLVAEIQQASYEGKPVFEVSSQPDEHSAEITLREGKSALLLIIPAGFSADLESLAGGQNGQPPEIIFVGDPSSDNYTFAVSFLEDLVRQFGESVAGRTSAAAVTYEFVPGTGTMSDIQYGVPGVIVFGVLFLIVSTAILLVRETSHHTLQRLRLTGAGAFPILAGTTLAQMIWGLLQIVIAWGAALAMGFHSPGSLVLAVFICMLLSLAAVGLGLITACFARNDGEAVNLATGVLVPMAFLSGAIFPMPPIPLATVAGQVIQAYDILPSAHAAEAMRRVLVFGEGIATIAYPLAALGVISAIYFLSGVFLFQKLRME